MDGPDASDMRLSSGSWGIQDTFNGPRLWRFQDGGWVHVADFHEINELLDLMEMLVRYPLLV